MRLYDASSAAPIVAPINVPCYWDKEEVLRLGVTFKLNGRVLAERAMIRVPRKSFRKDFFPATATANRAEQALQAAILVAREKHWMSNLCAMRVENYYRSRLLELNLTSVMS